MHFDLVDLRLFVNIVDADSLTQGAVRSRLTLPAVSMRIKNLESGLGGRLLVRSRRGVQLTPAGQAFVHHARLILGQAEQLRGELQEYSRGVKGHLRVAANTTAISEFLPCVMRSYLAAHPDVNVDLRERLSVDIVRSVLEGKTDVGIVSDDVDVTGLQTFAYRQERLVVALAGGHPLLAARAPSFADTLEHDYVTLDDNSMISGVLRTRAAELHRRLKVRIQVGNFEAMCRIVEAGVGIGMLPESALRRHRQSMRLEALHLREPWALRRLVVCVRDLHQLPGFARRLVDDLAADSTAAATAAQGPGRAVRAGA